MGKDRQLKPNAYCTVKTELIFQIFYDCIFEGLFLNRIVAAALMMRPCIFCNLKFQKMITFTEHEVSKGQCLGLYTYFKKQGKTCSLDANTNQSGGSKWGRDSNKDVLSYLQ